jgi:hypothetical protein
MRHAWIQPEIAALARLHGVVIEFETPAQLPASERPADMAYDQEFGRRLTMIGLDV